MVRSDMALHAVCRMVPRACLAEVFKGQCMVGGSLCLACGGEGGIRHAHTWVAPRSLYAQCMLLSACLRADMVACCLCVGSQWTVA
jgi:hypothetical protein